MSTSSSSPSMMIRGERGEEEGTSVVFSDHLLSGYGFQPTDVEILDHYLRSRLTSNSSATVPSYLIQEFDCYSMEPWNLPCDSFRYQNEEKDMHFFTRSRSRRAGRVAGCGFWQRNGRDSLIKVESRRLIGHKTHLVFMMLKGKEKEKKIKTDWIMHEFHLNSPSGTTKFDDLVLCRIRMKRSNNCCREREEDDTDAANTAYASSVAEVEEEEEPNQRLVKMKRAKEHGSMADNNESGTSNSGPTSSSSSSSSGSNTPQLVSREQPEGITSIDSGWL